jgi:hypothetical protein
VSMKRDDLVATIDLHRNPELWRPVDGRWALVHPLQ